MPDSYVSLPEGDKFLTAETGEVALVREEGGAQDGRDLVILTFGGWVGRTDQGGDIVVVLRPTDFRRLLDSGRTILDRNGL